MRTHSRQYTWPIHVSPVKHYPYTTVHRMCAIHVPETPSILVVCALFRCEICTLKFTTRVKLDRWCQPSRIPHSIHGCGIEGDMVDNPIQNHKKQKMLRTTGNKYNSTDWKSAYPSTSWTSAKHMGQDASSFGGVHSVSSIDLRKTFSVIHYLHPTG